jgi:3-oxoacyl-[acyl-carrier protein] reductase
MIDLSDRIALVTGAGQGIGAATAKSLADNGATVVVTDVSQNREAVAEAIEEGGHTAVAREMDVTDRDQVDAVFEEVSEELGTVDVLVNNAGIFPTYSFEELTREEWDRVIDVNLNGIFNCSKAAVPGMRGQGFGRIVNVSSVSGGKIGWSGNLSHYAASKGGVVGFTRSAAIDLGPHGITMNAVAPGWIKTEGAGMSGEQSEAVANATPVRRGGEPEELASLITYLASDLAGFVTGETIVADGGYTLV